jgi:phosphoribosylamine---glycine ligase
MNILVLGSGGREHAFTWKIKQSSKCKSLYVAPGNAGTANIATNVEILVTDFENIADFCLEKKIDLVVVGPEEPLVKGIKNYFDLRKDLKHISVLGPGKEGAQLEGSKDFSKEFMLRHSIPAARSKTFTANEINEGLEYLNSHNLPIVLKADGLAAGKGVIISETVEDAKTTLKEMLLDKKFGEASAKVVIEEFLRGIELSVFVLTDGESYMILPEAKDYKRIGEGDKGPNTGGMGAVSPVSFAGKDFLDKVEDRIIKPTISGLQKDNIDYTGFIFIGLMNVKGEPYVIEYNVRMGDPETEVVIPRINNDIVDLFSAAATRSLGNYKLEIDKRTATTVVLVSGGYPDAYEKGKTITGLEDVEGALVFHSGTKFNTKNEVITNGGRVLAMTGLGNDIPQALAVSYDAAKKVCWDNINYRSDIGRDLLELEKN